MIVKSAKRTFEVLDVIRRFGRAMRGGEIARELGIAPSSANDLLKTLVGAGCLAFDPQSKTYFPSLALADYGRWLASAYADLPAITYMMSRLQRASGESVVLSTLNGNAVQVELVIAGQSPPPDNIAEGRQIPLLGSAAGGAILMSAPDASIPALVRRASRLRSGSSYERIVSETMRTARHYRRIGYASTHRSDIIPHSWALAIPLPLNARNSQGRYILGLGGPAERIRLHEAELSALLRAHAQSLS